MTEPVGEDAWLSLVDEASRSAQDLEQRVEVVELYKKAVSAEPFSLKLWSTYCEWIWSLYTDCQSADAGWPEEEQELGQELFSVQTALDVLQQGAQATRYRLNDSHVLWNRWISLELEELAKIGDRPAIDRLRTLFLKRLQTPHATWDDTSQMFSTFLTKFDEAAWEQTMISVTQLAKAAKDLYSQREVHEMKIEAAISSEDEETLESTVLDYLAWESIQCSKKNGSWTLLVALYERALLLLSTNLIIWEDYATAVSSYQLDMTSEGRKPDPLASNHSIVPDIFTLLERATKHCPWSGSLWSRYILCAEMERLSFSEVEKIKHAATGSGQLDRYGLNDVLAVYSTWCEFLRRRAVHEDASDEDVDVADAGLSAALDGFQEWGQRLYGKKDYKGDPSFRLEQCLIRYLTQKCFISEARTQWEKLVKTHGNSYEFWQRYYLWEMTVSESDIRSTATSVLKQAVIRRGLDWPEKVMEIYLQHCEMYESTETVASAINLVHINSKSVAKRRQREALEAASTYAAQQAQILKSDIANSTPNEEAMLDQSPSGTSKRKRNSVTDGDGAVNKKAKWDEDGSEISQQKRNRENTSVVVTNLPPTVTQTKIKQFFKEYGHINNLTLKLEKDGLSATALVEFRSTDDVESAKIKDGKYLGDKQIHVEAGTGLTLYITNFPPTADEAYMHKLFENCGEIFSIRWPSLKYNTHRRFCYVSFRNAAAAAAATKLDGKLLEGRYKLEAKYSDPSNKKIREGASAEGREVHVSNIDRIATEDDLRDLFSKYGKVESIRVLRNVMGKSKGASFVVFEKKEEATEALALDKTKFMTQVLSVDLSTKTNYKPTATSILSKISSVSPAPDSDGDMQMSASPAPDSPRGYTQNEKHPSKAEIAQRTITLMNVPDTVNDARIRALVEPYGVIIKLSLRPDHQGAAIEFADVTAAGKATLALENFEITPGRNLRTGNLKDLYQEKDEIRRDRTDGAAPLRKNIPTSTTRFLSTSAPVRRPGPGGKGGLGTKRGLGFLAAKQSSRPAQMDSKSNNNEDLENGNQTEVTQPKPKNNADFKAMYLKGSE